MDKIYLCIDLKSFYASCECADRGLDSLKTRLVVADPSRGRGALCLAVSPALKELGVKNRCRLFEIPENIDYICAVPRMKRYMLISAKIYSIYRKYVAEEDIYVYSIDECFIDVTSYLKIYRMDVKSLAKMMIDDVFRTTGICATAGIGTNLFLAKVALDITAKHVDDHIGYLDDEIFKKEIWHHKPITDVWNISRGTAKRLLKYGVDDLYGITTLNEDILYKEFGINAEILIDHAHGIEPVTIKDIKGYRSKSNSISSQQILFENYDYESALLVLKEMVDLSSLELIEKKIVTSSISLYIGYTDDLRNPTGGTRRLNEFTQSRERLMDYFITLFKDTTDPNYLIRRMGIGFGNVVDEKYETIDLFTDENKLKKEKELQKSLIEIKKKYGKNAVIKGMDLESKATTIKRNELVGGHNAGGSRREDYKDGEKK
ncbi:MAG: hypothetical protein IJS83_03600 [Acholeplasmatales bacterium]|nr:hypothetical protein [Acholeplasmatales bacterium]